MPHRGCSTSSNGVHSRDRRVSFELLCEETESLINGFNQLAVDQHKEHLEVHREVDEGYLEWIEKKCPHAIRNFTHVENKLRNKKLAVFLDYDGTLTPIVRNPDQAYMSEEMRRTVCAVAGTFPTAIISGRGRDKVHQFVQLDELYYAGSHGLDIKAPSSSILRHDLPDLTLCQPAAAFEPLINVVYGQLCEAVRHITGAHVEHNKFCLSVHFRNCELGAVEELQLIVKEIINRYKSSLKTTTGRKVLEVRPRLEWDKGKAVEHLLKELQLSKTDVVPIYLGDDRTDEDAFKFLKRRGNGVGILVTTKVKSTEASYSLYDPSEVLVFLQKLLSWTNENTNIITNSNTTLMSSNLIQSDRSS